MIKDELVKKGVLHRDAVVCFLCKKVNDTVKHLLFKCYETWKVWMLWCNIWGITWVIPKDARGAIVEWNNIDIKSENGLLYDHLVDMVSPK